LDLDVLQREWLGNTLQAWSLAVVLGVITAFALRIAAKTVVRRLSAIAESTETYWDDVVAGVLGATKTWFLLIVGILVATIMLTLPADWEDAVRRAAAAAFILQGGFWAAAGVAGWLSNYRRQRMKDDPAAATTVGAIGFVGKIVLWSLVALLVLDNLGVNVTALVAGLGVGGIAVALAAQNLLGDLFASMSIVLDKPFVLGDFIVIGEFAGSVEHIGLKTTRIRSLTGEQLVFSNGDLLSSRVRNYGRMRERRILFGVGVTYQTPKAKLERIPGMLRQAVEAVERTRFDRSHFKAFGPSSLDFETVYYVQVPEYAAYMDAQQKINLAIVERFEAEGIEFAYPTQTIFLAKEGG